MKNDIKKVKEGDQCPHCKEGKLEIIKGCEPYSIDHLMCDRCDSTYCLDEK